MFGNKKEDLTAETTGTITEVKHASDDFGTDSYRVSVDYVVGGLTYSIREWARLENEFIKIGPIPIGQRKTPKIKNMQVGAPIAVLYDPQDPARAIIRDNGGHIVG